MIQALDWLLKEKQYVRLLKETARFLPSMQLFCHGRGFFSRADTLELFLFFHISLLSAVQGLDRTYRPLREDGGPLQRMGDLALLCIMEGTLLLKDVDPESKAINWQSGQIQGVRHESPALFREKLDIQDTGLEDIDGLIEEQYLIYRKTV